MKITIINGPNLNNLGIRDPGVYGNLSLDEINEYLVSEFPDDTLDFFQSNLEGEIINKIQSLPNTSQGLIINPGGYAHTSVAIRDSLEELNIPKIEVHLSNLSSREEYRHIMLTSSACDGYLCGFKEKGYYAGIVLLKMIIEQK